MSAHVATVASTERGEHSSQRVRRGQWYRVVLYHPERPQPVSHTRCRTYREAWAVLEAGERSGLRGDIQIRAEGGAS